VPLEIGRNREGKPYLCAAVLGRLVAVFAGLSGFSTATEKVKLPSMSRDYVTIVSGLPRSGTSMMMRMLRDGGIPPLIDNIRQPDEDNPKGYFEYEPVKKTKEDASWVETARGKVVKMVHLLLLSMPDGYDYRVIFMRRRLEEVVASQNVMLQRHNRQDDTLPEEKIIEMFKGQIDKVYAFMDSKPNFQYLEINYNNVLTDPEPAIQSIHRFLDTDLDLNAMRAVVDPALYRQRK
jgi:hypothetical protein